MTTPPDPLAALGFAAAHELDSSDDYLADVRGGETDDQAEPLTPEAERRARWQAYVRTTTDGRSSDDLVAEARDPDAAAELHSADSSPVVQDP